MAGIDFTEIVDRYYEALYRFAFSLSHCEATASDLTQQTYYVWARKGHQLRDAKKVKAWLFTTLYREFLNQQRRLKAHPHFSTTLVEAELPEVAPQVINRATVTEVLEALQALDEVFRVPLVLFHIEDHSYKEIAEILDIPIGTVMSRLSRGRQQLYHWLAREGPESGPAGATKIVPIGQGRRSG